MTREDAVRLIQAAESEPKAPHLADLIRLALNTGMRRGEMLGLEWQRVDIKAGLIHLEAVHTKAGKRRSVPLNDTARSALISRMRFRAGNCPASRWVFCDQTGDRIACVKRSFGTACRRAGIEDFHVHDLRHTCAAWLVSAAVPLPEVRDLLGHSTITMTERYAHLAPENVRAELSRPSGMPLAGQRRSARWFAFPTRQRVYSFESPPPQHAGYTETSQGGRKDCCLWVCTRKCP